MLGAAMRGHRALRDGFLHRLADTRGPTRMLARRFLGSKFIADTTAAGEMGVGLAAFESIQHGEMLTLDKAAGAYLALAFGHIVSVDPKHFGRKAMFERSVVRDFKDFLKTEDAQPLHDLYKSGSMKEYRAAVGGKLAEIRAAKVAAKGVDPDDVHQEDIPDLFSQGIEAASLEYELSKTTDPQRRAEIIEEIRVRDLQSWWDEGELGHEPVPQQGEAPDAHQGGRATADPLGPEAGRAEADGLSAEVDPYRGGVDVVSPHSEPKLSGRSPDVEDALRLRSPDRMDPVALNDADLAGLVDVTPAPVAEGAPKAETFGQRMSRLRRSRGKKAEAEPPPAPVPGDVAEDSTPDAGRPPPGSFAERIWAEQHPPSPPDALRPGRAKGERKSIEDDAEENPSSRRDNGSIAVGDPVTFDRIGYDGIVAVEGIVAGRLGDKLRVEGEHGDFVGIDVREAKLMSSDPQWVVDRIAEGGRAQEQPSPPGAKAEPRDDLLDATRRYKRDIEAFEESEKQRRAALEREDAEEIAWSAEAVLSGTGRSVWDEGSSKPRMESGAFTTEKWHEMRRAEEKKRRIALKQMLDVADRRVGSGKIGKDTIYPDAKGPTGRLTPTTIEALSRTDAGREYIEKLGYSKAQIKQAIVEAKEIRFSRMFGGSTLFDITSIFSPEFAGPAAYKAGKYVKEGFRGLYRGTCYVTGGVIEAIDHGVLRPVDRLVGDYVNKAYYDHIADPMEKRWAAVGDAMQDRFFHMKGTGRIYAKLIEIAPLYWDPELRKDRGLKRKINRYTDYIGADAFQALNMAQTLGDLYKNGAAARNMALNKKYHDVEGMVVDLYVHRYSAVDAHGRRPGAELVREILNQATAEGKVVDPKMREMVNHVVEIIDLMQAGEMPSDYMAMHAGFADAFNRIRKIEMDSGILKQSFTVGKFETEAGAQAALAVENRFRGWYNWKIMQDPETGTFQVVGETAAMRPGLNYLPDYLLKSIQGKAESGLGARWEIDNDPKAAKTRMITDGTLYHELVLGNAPQSYNMADLYQKHHTEVMKAVRAREMSRALLGHELNGRPAAILRSQLQGEVSRQSGKLASALGLDLAKLPHHLRAVAMDEAVRANPNHPAVQAHAEALAALRDYVSYENIPGFKIASETGHSDAMVFHPRVARVIGNLTAEPTHNWMQRVNGAFKLAQLTMSPFHYWALAMNTLAYGENPVKALAEHRRIVNTQEALDIVRSGLTMNSTDVHLSGYGYDAVWGKPGRVGKLRRRLQRSEDYFQKKLWDEMYRSTKIMSALAAERAYIEMGVAPKMAREYAVTSVNSLHGGLNYQRWGMSVKAKQFASMLMLAPDWTISNTMWSMDAQLGLGVRSAVNRAAFVRFMTTTYVMSNIANIMTSGHPMWENEDGHKHHIEISRFGRMVHMNAAGHMGEFTELLIGSFNTIAGDRSPLGNYGRDPSQYLIGKAAPIFRIATEQKSGMRMGGGLPTATDYWHGETRGQYMKPQHRADAKILAMLRAGAPISAVNVIESVIQDPRRFYTSGQFLTGIVGRQFEERTQRKSKKSGTRRAKPRVQGGW
jgi:hypothetical protein